eukprot:SAG11_NODE_13790_length_639_cov_1.092593_1_plen_29_part_10
MLSTFGLQIEEELYVLGQAATELPLPIIN